MYIHVCLNHFAARLRLTGLHVSAILQQETKGVGFPVCDCITVSLNFFKKSKKYKKCSSLSDGIYLMQSSAFYAQLCPWGICQKQSPALV